jgi:ubiquinone/menaquinone biosynthesis C-methylase UbiE
MTTTLLSPDFSAIKQKQQAVWSSGDYAVVGTTLQLVGESLCEAIDIRSGERVIDVAAGNGNATLAAARHYADVTSTDYVRALLERGEERAAAERLTVTFKAADAEDLPFDDGSFDVALSIFGVMFAPNHEKSAAEMSRVLRKGGRIGLANWTPEGFIGQLFKVLGRHVAPPAGVRPPSLWGTADHLAEIFPRHKVTAAKRIFNFRYRSAAHFTEVFKTFYGPTHRAFLSLEAAKRELLEADMMALLNSHNRGGRDSLVVPSEYLEAIVVKR